MLYSFIIDKYFVVRSTHSIRDVLHLVVDDYWRDVVLLLEDFRCLGSEGCGGVGTRDVMDGCKC